MIRKDNNKLMTHYVTVVHMTTLSEKLIDFYFLVTNCQK